MALKKMCVGVEALRSEKRVQWLSPDFIFQVVAKEEVRVNQPDFEIRICHSQSQHESDKWVAFHARVLFNGDISLRSADNHRYTQCGDPFRAEQSKKSNVGDASAEPTHSYGTVLQLVADTVTRHQLLKPELMA